MNSRPTPSLEARLARFADIEEIRGLLHEYGRTLDGRDSLQYSRLFAAAGEWVSGDHSARTPDGIRAMVERVFAALPADGSTHVFSDIAIVPNGDRAAAESRFLLLTPTSGAAPVVKLSGRYHDELIREDGRWRFLRRVLSHDDAGAARPAPLPTIRRVVTGHDERGRSIVLWDGEPTIHRDIGRLGMTLNDIWETHTVPAQFGAREPDPTAIPLHFAIPATGVRMRYLDIPPGASGEPFMHRTASLDYVVCIEGEMTMLMDDETVVLKRGDVVVQRGTNHAWVNRSNSTCRMLYIIIGAELAPQLMQTLGLTELKWDAATGGTTRGPGGPAPA